MNPFYIPLRSEDLQTVSTPTGGQRDDISSRELFPSSRSGLPPDLIWTINEILRITKINNEMLERITRELIRHLDRQ